MTLKVIEEGKFLTGRAQKNAFIRKGGGIHRGKTETVKNASGKEKGIPSKGEVSGGTPRGTKKSDR